jgi:uncharacterized protein YggE
MQVHPDYALLSIALRVSKNQRDAAMARASRIVDALHARLDGLAGVRAVRFTRVTVRRSQVWDEKRKKWANGQWFASVTGHAEVDVESVSTVVTAAVAARGEIVGVSWHLDDENPAHRDVRKRAVREAHRAAQDFADALGVKLGPLVSLADPGLLSRASFYADDPFPGRSAARYGLEMAHSMPMETPEIDLDPQPRHVAARVEGSYRLVA